MQNVERVDADIFLTEAMSPVSLRGLCSINGGDDEACWMLGLSLDRGRVLTRANAAFSDEVILSLPHIGLQKGVVAHIFNGGFEVQFAEPAHPKLPIYLAWLNGDVEGRKGHENRRHDRIVPIRRLITLERDGDLPSMARIIDVSRSGVAFTTSRNLRLGDRIWIGRHKAVVVRILDGGAAVEFDALLPEDDFDPMIDLMAV